MGNALAWLSVESLRRMWSGLSAAEIESSRDEEELIKLIAGQTGESASAIRRKLAAARAAAVGELLRLGHAAPSVSRAPQSASSGPFS